MQNINSEELKRSWKSVFSEVKEVCRQSKQNSFSRYVLFKIHFWRTVCSVLCSTSSSTSNGLIPPSSRPGAGLASLRRRGLQKELVKIIAKLFGRLKPQTTTICTTTSSATQKVEEKVKKLFWTFAHTYNLKVSSISFVNKYLFPQYILLLHIKLYLIRLGRD